MRLSVFTIAFTLIATSLFAQKGNNYIQLSQTITKETKNITGFDKIDISEDFKVYVRFSDTEEKVEIEANENLHDLIQVVKVGNTLKINTKSYSTGMSNKGGARERLVAYITTKKLTGIRAYEDVVIKLEDKLMTDQLTIDLDEDCVLKGHIEAQDLVVRLDEDSILDIEGSAQTMEVKANEDSMIKSFDFVVHDLLINLKEDSMAKLTVNGEIKLIAAEDSLFHYKGTGEFTRKLVIGDSEVVRSMK